MLMCYSGEVLKYSELPKKLKNVFIDTNWVNLSGNLQDLQKTVPFKCWVVTQ